MSPRRLTLTVNADLSVTDASTPVVRRAVIDKLACLATDDDIGGVVCVTLETTHPGQAGRRLVTRSRPGCNFDEFPPLIMSS